MLHVPWGEELALLDVHDGARLARRQQEVGLTAKEGGDLQHVYSLRRAGALAGVVHVREDGAADAGANLGQCVQSRLQPHAALARDGGAVGLVEARLEDIADPGVRRRSRHRLGDHHGVVEAFERAGPRDQAQGRIGANLHPTDIDGSAFIRHQVVPVWSSDRRLLADQREGQQADDVCREKHQEDQPGILKPLWPRRLLRQGRLRDDLKEKRLLGGDLQRGLA